MKPMTDKELTAIERRVDAATGEADFEDYDERPIDDPNQCPQCGDNLDEFDRCFHCDY